MADTARIRYLRIALQAVGVIFIAGIYSFVVQMILGVYATLGMFLLIASRNPLANLESYLVHGVVQLAHAGIMAAQALANPEQIGHLWGDVPALLVVAAVLAFLTPRGTIATALAVGKKINS